MRLVYSLMTSDTSPPDYDLEDTIELTTPEQVRAIGDPLRTTILGLLHERAATVTEIATALKRPKSTVAHHINVLEEAGLVRVVRTRRVRAIDERFFGRTARMFYVGLGRRPGGRRLPPDFNDFEVAASESEAAYKSGQLRAFIRHARRGYQRSRRLTSGRGSTPSSTNSISSTAQATPCMDSPSASTRCPITRCSRPGVIGCNAR